MLNINFYETKDDEGNQKFIITIDVTATDIESLPADEIGNLIKEAVVSQPPVAI